MNKAWGNYLHFGLAIICLSTAAYLCATADKDKLQVGIRFRPEVCERKAAVGDSVSVHYVGKLVDGTEFDNSYTRGKPISFSLGQKRVIAGWEQGILGMCVGEKRMLKIPPAMGYGEAGSPPTIPGNAMLVFETELTEIK